MLYEKSGRSLRGPRLEEVIALGHCRIPTFIVRLRVDELAVPRVLDGPMNRAIFDTYIKAQQAPWLLPGEVMSANSLSSHKFTVVRALLKAQEIRLLFLPTCS